MSGPLMSALQQAKAAVEEGIALLKDRHKVIKLADRSELGWAVANEYGEDELAKDLDDEKRIAKVVATAERKAAQLKKSHFGSRAYNKSQPANAPSRVTHQESGYQGPSGYFLSEPHLGGNLRITIE